MGFSGGLRKSVEGKVVVVTGSSEGIGARLAGRLAAAGARVVLIARSLQKLEEVQESITSEGGEAHLYSANLSCEKECDRVLSEILADHGRVDIFVSNAGRSIRRSVKYQGGDRFHDFQRLMALNYFGALRLILGVLPGMEERGFGHIVHVSSFGVPTRQSRFAGYCASKCALDAALQCAAGEVKAKGVDMSTVYMPLVQTKMVESKGHSYDHVSMLSVDEACEYIEHAIITKRAEVIDAPSRWWSLVYIFRPSFINGLNSLVYRLEGEKAPDDVIARAPKRKSTRKLKMQSSSKNRLLKFLSSFMWFFSRLELLLFLRVGVPWIFRDILAVLVMVLVLIVHAICVAGVAAAGAARRCHRRLAGPAVAQAVPCPRSADDGAVEAAPPTAAKQPSAEGDVAEGVAPSSGAEAKEWAEVDTASACRRRERAAKTCRLGRKQSWSASQPCLAPRSRSLSVIALSTRGGSLRRRKTATWQLA